jgi:hypothetical protein
MALTMPSFMLFGINSEMSTKVWFLKATLEKASFQRGGVLEAQEYRLLKLVEWHERLQRSDELVPVLDQANV